MKRKIVAVLTACISLFISLFGIAMPVGAKTDIPNGQNLSAELLQNADFSGGASSWYSYNGQNGTEDSKAQIAATDGALKVSNRNYGSHDGPAQNVTAALNANGAGRYYFSAKVKFDPTDAGITLTQLPRITNAQSLAAEDKANAYWVLEFAPTSAAGYNEDSFRIKHVKTGLYLAAASTTTVTMRAYEADDQAQVWQIDQHTNGFCWDFKNRGNNQHLYMNETTKELALIADGDARFGIATVANYEAGLLNPTDKGLVDTDEKRNALNGAEVIIARRFEGSEYWSEQHDQFYFSAEDVENFDVIPEIPMYFNLCLELQCSDNSFGWQGKTWFSIFSSDHTTWTFIEDGDDWVTVEGYMDIWWKGNLQKAEWRPYTKTTDRSDDLWSYNYLIDNCSLKRVLETPSSDGDYRLDFYNRTLQHNEMPISFYAADDEVVTLPDVPVTANGKLGYWSLREDGKYKRYEPGESYTVKSDTTFYFVTPTIDLTIAAETENHVAQSFIYEITSTDGFSMVVCVEEGDSLTIYDLPAAVDYTVTELTAHSWRYTTATAAAGGASGTTSIVVGVANASGGVVEVTFSHSDRNDKWLSGTDYKELEYVPQFEVSQEITLHEYEESGQTKHNLEVFNTGNIDIYVRVAITTHYVDGEGNILGAKGSWDSLLPTGLGDGWVKHTDGFYYYTKPIKSGRVVANTQAGTHTTGLLFASNFNFPSADAGWMYSAQSVEAHKDALRNTWMVNVSVSEDGTLTFN